MPGCTHSWRGYDDRVRDTTPRANLNPLVSIMVTVKFTLEVEVENMDNKPREEILNHVIEHYLDAELAMFHLLATVERNEPGDCTCFDSTDDPNCINCHPKPTVQS